MPWTPFHWDCNSTHGQVRSREDWWRLVRQRAEVKGIGAVLSAREMLDRGTCATWDHPNTLLEAGSMQSIGFRREHIGGMPFRDWLAEQGMNVADLETPPQEGSC